MVAKNTAKIELASEETDVKSVKQHLHEKTTEKQREASVEIINLILDGSDEDIVSKAKELKESVDHDLLPIDSEHNDFGESVKQAAETFENHREHPKGQKLINNLTVTANYFYDQNDTTYEDMVRIQERAIANDNELFVTVPI